MTMQTLTLRVEAADAGTRIDKYLSERADLTRSAAVRLIEEGGVSIGGASVSKNCKVKCGDEITVARPLSPSSSCTSVMVKAEFSAFLNMPTQGTY